MGLPADIVKYLFFIFNLIIWILGIVVLAVGIHSRIENDSWKDLINSETLLQAANLLIAAGIFVTILGFLGCCGAIKKLQWMLVIYSVIIFLIFILEIAAGIFAISNLTKIEKKLEKGVKKAVQISYGKSDKASVGLTKSVDYFQEEVECCGAEGPADWLDSYWYQSTQNTTAPPATTPGGNATVNATAPPTLAPRQVAQVPSSCCRKVSAGCNVGVNENSTSIFNQGCIKAGTAFAWSNIKMIANVGVVIAVIELLGIIIAMCLCRQYRREERGDPID